MIEKQDLINEAYNAMKKSYAPFTDVKVGAAILTGRNKCYTGYNFEFSSKRKNSNAERMAFSEAFEKGDKDIKKIVIVSNTETFVYPSGISRQMIYDLANKAEIILINDKGEERIHTIEELLPYPERSSNKN